MDVFGGQTANTEYEVLTGNSIAFMTAGVTPYMLFVRSPQPALLWTLRDLDYAGNIAFHPYTRKNYNRPEAYDSLGFEQYVAMDSIKSRLTHASWLRNRVSDATDFEEIIRMYEETRAATSDPFLLFNVTMQNHSPFDAPYDNFEESITLSGDFADDSFMKRYINLANRTDEAFEQLAEYFSQVPEPTVLVMFGDHQPKLDNKTYQTLYGKDATELTEEELFQRYQTPLTIWANYEINPGNQFADTFEDLSVNYLSAALMELTGLPQTAQQSF